MSIPNQTPGAQERRAADANRPDPKTVIQLYEQAKTLRQPFEQEWRLAAAHCFPEGFSAWGHSGLPDVAALAGSRQDSRRHAFDTTGLRSVPKYVAVLNRLATPNNMLYHTLTPRDPTLRKAPRVRQFFEDLNKTVWDKRYEAAGGFIQASSAVYASMAVYGPGPMVLGRRKLRLGPNSQPGVFYKSCSLLNLFVLFDTEGKAYMWFYRRLMTVADFEREFPGQALPPCLARVTDLKARHKDRFEIIEWVRYRESRDGYDPEALDNRKYPILQDFICVPDAEYVGGQSGFMSPPYLLPRGDAMPDVPWGSSPALRALGSLGAASVMKKQLLQHGLRMLQPTILAHDDAVFNGGNPFKPASVLAGGLNRQGQAMYQPLMIGDPRYTEQMMQDERFAIEDSFLVNLFRVLQDNPRTTATEIMEEVAEKTALLMPLLGMLQTEFLGPMITREIELLAELGLTPEQPPELKEAGRVEYQIVYTSPLAKAVYAEEITAFLRLWDITANIANATGDPSVFDHFNLSEALPEIADNMAVPSRFLTTEEERQQLAEARAQQQQLTAGLENAAGLSSLARAAQGA